MDALSDILSTVVLQFCQVGTMRLSAPGAFRCRAADTPKLASVCLSVVQGEPIWMSSKGGPGIRLMPGDIVFLSRDADVVMADSLDTAPTDIRSIWAKYGLPDPVPENELARPLRVEWGGGGKETLLLGFAFGVAGGNDNPLLKTLHELTILRATENSVFPWVPHIVAFLTAEDTNVMPGFAATARALSELVFVSLVRAWVLKTLPSDRGWLRGLLDPRIARSLSAIHKNPSQPWSVELLSKRAGMSRTSFAARFVELVGQPPIEYLTSWRMHLARCRLREGKCGIAELTNELGYSSEAVFRQTFKRHTGVSPSSFAARAAVGDKVQIDTMLL